MRLLHREWVNRVNPIFGDELDVKSQEKHWGWNQASDLGEWVQPVTGLVEDELSLEHPDRERWTVEYTSLQT